MITAFAIFTSTIAGLLLLVKIWWMLHKRSGVSTIRFIPGDIPIFGHIFMLQDREKFSQMKDARYKEFGNSFGIHYMSTKVIFTKDISVFEELLLTQKCMKKGFGYWLIEKFAGTGLAVTDGELWRKRRKMISPTFHFDTLGGFVSIMEKQTFALLVTLEKLAEQESVFNAFDVTKRFTFRIICETAMGIEDNICDEFSRLFLNTSAPLVHRQLRPYLKSDWLYSLTKEGQVWNEKMKELKTMVQKVVERRIEVRKDPNQHNATRRKIFLDVLLDAYEKEDIDVEGILNEVNTFVLAGFDSTSLALAWCLYCLGRNKDAQDKLYREVSSFGKQDSLQLDDLKDMRYLDLVCKETVRLHPSFPRISRYVPEGTILGGQYFPECSVAVDIMAVNRNPEVWEDPLTFRPERFENIEKEGKKASLLSIPFSAGPRNCIGQRFAVTEMKVALYHLIRQFEVTSTQKESELQETFNVTHVSENGLMLTIQRRPETL